MAVLDRTEPAALLRAFRRRSGLKQAALAEMLGISQAYYSRLEGGLHEPSRGLAVKIDELLDDHQYRSTFDQCRLSVRYSPCLMIMIGQHKGVVRLEDASRGAQRLGGFYSSLQCGDCLEGVFGEEADAFLEKVKSLGMFDGNVAVVEATWKDTVSEEHVAFRTILTSVRDDFGHWHVVANLQPLNACEYSRMSQAEASFRVLT